MLSVRVMRKTKGKRLLRHRMARVLMVEEPLPRLRSERPVSNGRLEKWKGTFRRFRQGSSEILHQLLLEYGDEFKCVPGPKSLHKIAPRNNTVCQHFHFITSDINIVCITISLASCDSSPSCHRAARVPLPITFPYCSLASVPFPLSLLLPSSSPPSPP